MKITTASPAAHEFACHSAACAPPPAGTGGSLRGWKTFAYGSRVTTWVRPSKTKGEALRIVNNAAHNAGSGYGLSKVAGGKATKIGDYTTPAEAAEAASKM